MKKAITIAIKNNTTVVQAVQIGIPPNVFSGINATTQYRWNITSQNLNDLTTIELTYVLNGQTTTVSADITSDSVNGIIDALNSLNVGSFWSTTSGGNTFIHTYNDFITYTNLVINNNGNILITATVTAPASALNFSLTLNSPNQMFWDWGDGTVQEFNSNNPSPSHMYSAAGVYTIIVTFTNPASLLTINCANQLTAVNIVENNLTGLQLFFLNSNNLTVFNTTNLSNSTSLATLKLDNNDIISFDPTPLANSVTTLWLHGNNLTSINTPFPTGITSLLLHSNNLSVAYVNAVLIALDTAGQLNGTVNVSSQTPSAPPSGAGITAKNNLIGKGWTVFTD